MTHLVVDAELYRRMLDYVALLTTCYGVVSCVTARRSGVLARTVLFGHRTRTLGVMAIVTTLSGAALGAVITALASWHDFRFALPWAPLVSAVSALSGMFIGIIVRSIVLGS